MNAVRETARRIGLGKALRHLYHRPLGLARRSIAEGGPLEQAKTAAGEKEMIEAAERLTALVEPPIGPVAEVSFLTGPRFWHQTVFCFISLQSVLPFRVTPIIYSDGSLTEAIAEKIRKSIPWAQFQMTRDVDERIDQELPESSYPILRKRRREYPHLRKLIDLHIPSSGFTLVADSDMLFFDEPTELVDWFKTPHPLYIQDIGTFYGYDLDYLSDLAGHAVPERVNVGLYALNSGAIDWERVEFWCKKQVDDFGGHYLQEQALTAMLLAPTNPKVLGSHYRVKPDHKEGLNPSAVLHHYVAESKRAYFQRNWRKFSSETVDE